MQRLRKHQNLFGSGAFFMPFKEQNGEEQGISEKGGDGALDGGVQCVVHEGRQPLCDGAAPTTGGTGETSEGDCEEGKEWPCSRER